MNQSKLKNVNDIMSLINYLCELLKNTYITEPLQKPSIDKENIGKTLNTLITSIAKDDQNIKQKLTPKEGGPFFKQQQKLKKAKHLMHKKEKAKKAKNTAAAIACKIHNMEITDSNSNNKSDISDVIMVSIPPPSTFTEEVIVNENDYYLSSIIFDQEEKSLDSMRHSGCTTPCSIQPWDKFIGQNDRNILLTGATDMADDKNLLVLISHMNSVLKAPQLLKQSFGNKNIYSNEVQELDLSVKRKQENKETSNPLKLETNKTLKRHDYIVEEDLFSALNIYESESDITDMAYSRKARKSGVIKELDTSSSEEEYIGNSYSQKTKRLCKRRASSNNTKSIVCNTNAASSPEDDNVLLVNELVVEHCKQPKRRKSIEDTDSSGTDIEKPYDDTQIITFPDDTSKAKKTRTEYDSPIYNDIPGNRGQTLSDGLGWNAKIRKFYNDSCNGDYFSMHKFFQKLNLWD